MPDRHSKHMENLSLIMGIIALSTFCLVYPALICGALGIVFALLSRGGETTFSGRAKAWAYFKQRSAWHYCAALNLFGGIR